MNGLQKIAPVFYMFAGLYVTGLFLSVVYAFPVPLFGLSSISVVDVPSSLDDMAITSAFYFMLGGLILVPLYYIVFELALKVTRTAQRVGYSAGIGAGYAIFLSVLHLIIGPW